MNIAGFQKLSLIDYPGKVASVIFTQGCNFRCPYCHNPELIPMKVVDVAPEKEILAYLEAHRAILEGVCITGGEPTMQADLPDFMQRIKMLGFTVKLDTNGSNPSMMERIIAQRLADYFAMDLKHSWERYARVAKTNNASAIENCKKTFRLIQDSGIDHEFRTTVFPQEHTEEDFFDIVGYLREGERYVLQRISYQKTLNPKLDGTIEFDVDNIAQKLQETFPRVTIGVR